MTSKIVVNNIEADAGVSTVFFNSDIGATDGTLNVDGNLTVDGVITYEDVTNVDSVGIVTARSGLRVTGGSVGIGTDNPSAKFELSTNNTGAVQNNVIRFTDTDGSFQAGQSPGRIEWNTSDANSPGVTAYIDTYGYTNAVSDLVFGTGSGGSATERLRIRYDGNIGIGTDNPDGKLAVTGNGYNQINIASNNTANTNKLGGVTSQNYVGDKWSIIQTYSPSGSNQIYYGSADGSYRGATGHYFYVNSSPTATTGHTQALRITSAGDVGIGSNAPSQKLNVAGNIMLEGSDQYMYLTNVGTGNAGIYVRGRDATNELRSHSTGMFTWEVAGNEKMRLTSDGSVAIGTAGNMGSNYARISIDCQGRDVLTGVTDITKYGLAFHNDPNTNDANGIGFFNDDGTNCGGYILHQDKGSNNLGDLIFGTSATSNNPVERLRITSDGKLGIKVTSPGCQTGGIHAVHDATEGTPSFTGGEVGIFQRNYNSAQGCEIGIIGGSNSSSRINFGDKDDADIGIISYSHNDNSMRFIVNTEERLRITSDGHLVYDTNKGGIYNFDKACSSNASTNIFRIDNDHGAHCFTIYMTGSNSGNSVSKIYNVACKYGTAPTINSAADTGAYGSNNFSLTGSASGRVHTFAISVTGAAATISCTVVLGSMNTSATVTVL